MGPQAAFERDIAPSPELFAGERILGTIEAGFEDIGLLGYLLRRKDRLVVTTDRLFRYSRTFISANFRCLELAKVEAIEVGSQFNVMQFVAGIVLLLGAVLLVAGAISVRSEKTFFIVCSLLSALAGSFAVITSEKKVLQASGSNPQNTVRLPVARLGLNESKSFVDLISAAVRNLNESTMATADQSGRKPNEILKDLKSANTVRGRTSHMAPSPLNQSFQEPDEAVSGTFNGRDNRYRNSRFTPPFTPQPSHELTEPTNTSSNDGKNSEYETSPSHEARYWTPSSGWVR